MDQLESILGIASRQLPAAGVECLLIGGFAVNHYGFTRNTLDVDFMIVGDQLDAVRPIMQQAGFTNISIQDNAAYFSMPKTALRVDFLCVDAETMNKLLVNAVEIRMHSYGIRVPALLDLIAMKIFSLSQDLPRRTAKDLPDIAYLTLHHELDLESKIRPLCDRFGTEAVYILIKDQVKALRAS